MGPIDVQRRIARQKGERLARRARSHVGFSAIDQSLDAGFKPCFSKINDSVTTETSVRALLLSEPRPLCEEGFAQPKIGYRSVLRLTRRLNSRPSAGEA